MNGFFSSAELAAALFLLGTGLWFTVKTRFRFWNVPWLIKRLPSSKKTFFTALSGTLGIGNIIGVSRAIQIGGPGAVFWIFLCALICATVKSAEICIGLKKTSPRPLPLTFSLLLCAVTMGIMAQSNAAISLLESNNNALFFIYSATLILTVFLFLCLSPQNGERILSVLTPVMAGIYLLAAGAVILTHISAVPHVAVRIVAEAFRPQATVTGIGIGAFLQTVRAGCLNGIFSHEAGLGSAPLAHSTGDPDRECLFGAVEVYTDSLIVSGLTAFCLLSTGTSDIAEAFGTVFGSLGRPAAVAVIAVFAVSSILCWVHYTDTLVPLSPLIRFAVPAVCIVGIVLPSDTVWQAATFSVSLATVVNLFYLLKHQKTFFSSFG